MKIPATEYSLVLRADFSDDSAWVSIVAEIQRPIGHFRAYVELIDDPEYAGLEGEQVISLLSRDPARSFAFIVDYVALSHPEHPILVIDLLDEPGRTFRVVPSAMWSVENNLSIANMGFDEFVEAVDRDGIFRGFQDAD